MDIKDLEMAVKIRAWLVFEGIVRTENLRYKHVGLFSNNMAAVLWTQRRAIVLDLRQQMTRASLLVAAHIAGDLNVLGDIPYRSFGYSKQWNCTNDSDFLSLIKF